MFGQLSCSISGPMSYFLHWFLQADCTVSIRAFLSMGRNIWRFKPRHVVEDMPQEILCPLLHNLNDNLYTRPCHSSAVYSENNCCRLVRRQRRGMLASYSLERLAARWKIQSHAKIFLKSLRKPIMFDRQSYVSLKLAPIQTCSTPIDEGSCLSAFCEFVVLFFQPEQ